MNEFYKFYYWIIFFLVIYKSFLHIMGISPLSYILNTFFSVYLSYDLNLWWLFCCIDLKIFYAAKLEMLHISDNTEIPLSTLRLCHYEILHDESITHSRVWDYVPNYHKEIKIKESVRIISNIKTELSIWQFWDSSQGGLSYSRGWYAGLATWGREEQYAKSYTRR